MNITVKQADVLAERGDMLVVGFFKGLTQPAGLFAELNKAFDGKLEEILADERFEGADGEWASFQTFGKLKVKRIACVGLGERSAFECDVLRKVGGMVAKRGRELKAKRIVMTVPGIGIGTVSAREGAQALAEGLRLGAYRFHAYKSKGKEKRDEQDVRDVIICEAERLKVAPIERGIAAAGPVAAGVHIARDLVNTPSADMTPAHLAEAAQKIAASDRSVSVKILDKARMERLGMRAALAVARGSMHEPVGVHLVYKPQRQTKKVKKIAVVGKAVTFDSGGLSLKPADAMMTMKCDMAGAAAVLGLFHALPALAPNAEVHGIFLAVENMPGGRAYRPGDVIKAMNGTTIEILNTDAEGRVTLADALSYAATLEPDGIIDLATLTGAAVVALGEEIAALMSNDRKLCLRLQHAAREAGEPLWELPLFAPYEEHVKSKIADLKNVGNRGQAGTISAALFLKAFVGKTPWAHFDIGGPAYMERESRPDLPYGATGCGVRTLARYLQALS